MNVLGGKWKTVLLAQLKQGPKRYGDLRQLVPRLSQKMLTQRLHELERDGLVDRLPVDGEARYHHYVLTGLGASLQPVLQALYDWGRTHEGRA
ncbi:MAG: helix-turn-helix domain-containing protein [Polyangiaceae bacterium]